MNHISAAATSGRRRSCPPGNGCAGTRAIDVETLGFAQRCFRHELAAERRQRHALSGIAVREKLALRAPPEMRHARSRDSDGAVPAVLDRRIGELREDMRHARTHQSGHILRHVPIALASGEQHAAVRALAVVVEHVARVGHGRIAGQHRAVQRLAERRGGDDEALDVADIFRKLRRDGGAERIAGEKHALRRHEPVGATDVHARFVLVEREHARMLKQLGAGVLRRARQTARVVQGMQMPAAQVHPRRGIDARAEPARGLVLVHHAREAVAICAGEMLGVLGERAHHGLVVGGDDEAVLERAIDSMRSDERAHCGLGLVRQVPEVTGMHRPEPGLQLRLVLAMAGMDLAAVSPRGREADGFGLQKDDLGAGLGQGEGGDQARIARAYHAELGLARALQTRPQGRRIGAGGIVTLRRESVADIRHLDRSARPVPRQFSPTGDGL